MERFWRGVLIACFIAVFAMPSFAETPEDVQMQIEKMSRQLSEMNASMEAQKAEIEALQEKVKELKAKESLPVAKETVPAAAPAAKEVKVSSKYNIKIYGKIKMDAIYDTNNMGRDEFITFVPNTANERDKVSFNVRDTRLGVAIEGPSYNGWQASGRFETDFYGTDPNSNGQLRIRLSYIDIAKGGTAVRVGQDWTPIASLNPNTIDFAIMGYNGNLWSRVPQITVRQNFGGGLEGLVTTYRYLSSNDDVELRMPWVGAKVAYTTPQKAYVALGAAVRNGEVNDTSVTPYLAALEAKLPLGIVELSGEAYVGQGLGVEYFHRASVNGRNAGDFNVDGDAIQSRGAWAQVSVRPFDRLQFNAGYGLDDPRDEDAGTGFYQQSEYTFGNVQVKVLEDVTAGLEAAYVETDWATGAQNGTRFQASLIYNW